MTQRTTPTHWTYEDLLALPDDGKRHEIIDGEHFVTPSPSFRHQDVLSSLYFFIAQHVRAGGLGKCLFAPLDVILSNDTVVEPDLLFVTKERLSIFEQRGAVAAPDLVVEVLSPSTKRRDYGIKLDTFAKHGVREYWIVDPLKKRVEIFTRQGERLVRHTEVTHGRLTSPVVLPGFSVAFEEIFTS